MSQTVYATLDNYHEDIEEIFPVEKYDSIVGAYGGHKFQVRYEPPETEEEAEIRGKFILSIFAQKENPIKNEGGVVLYSERHTSPEGYHEMRPLFVRARKIAVKLATNDKYHQCPYCNFLANDEWKIERSLSIFPSKSRRRIPIFDDKHTEYCAGLSKWIPPKVEVYQHKKDENPFFSQRELNNCETLRIAPGYPEWRYKSQLYPYTYYELTSLLEDHPETLDEDLDQETMKRVIRYVSYDNDLPSEQLTNNRNFTTLEH